MNVILTTYQGAILGPIARVLGYILQALYALLANFGIENTGICMILFTFLVNGNIKIRKIRHHSKRCLWKHRQCIRNMELVRQADVYLC